ncbi:phosphoribosyltransferase family protein [Nonomuraea sp. C10]|uniref:phosphoribosyltransferase family protein n=1 Tax=Nonomuraea sp. C10 TaxID=2600577 RepID=UPI0021C39A60|nr:phosphoribosyltransferase family protein [Nonomuraea sp. C10]
MRKAVIAYKERGEAALAAALADLLAFALVAALRSPQEVAEGAVERFRGRGSARSSVGLRGVGECGLLLGGEGVIVVPVPSGRAAVKGRGHDHVGALAERVVRRLRGRGMAVTLWPALRQRRKVADQSGLSSADRVSNLAGSFSVSESAVRDLEVAGRGGVHDLWAAGRGGAHDLSAAGRGRAHDLSVAERGGVHDLRVAGRGGVRVRGSSAGFVRTAGDVFDRARVVVVDDVVTTGATLADAARALRAVGATVPLAVTVAATRRISRNGHGDSQ